MAGGESGLEYRMPRQSSATAPGAPATRGAAGMCDRRQAGAGGGRRARGGGRHFRDQHGAGNRPDPGDGTPDASRRGRALVAGRSSVAMSCPIRAARSAIRCVGRAWAVVSMAADISADPGVPGASICAASRFRGPACCPRRDTRAPGRGIFSAGRRRPASGRKTMNGAMRSASILSVFARVPRLAAPASICPGGNRRVVTPAAARGDHSRHCRPPPPGKTSPGSSSDPRSLHGRQGQPASAPARPGARALHPCGAIAGFGCLAGNG